MLKLSGLAAMALAIGMPAAPVVAAPVGPHAAACARGEKSAMLVHVTGFKTRRGTLRVQSYGGDPDSYFEKGRYLERIDVPVPADGAADICMPVPAAGAYAVSVRHDVDGDRKSGRADGGGMSGNPKLSLMDLIFKRKPSAKEVSVRVGTGVARVPVLLNYVQGTSFRPVPMTAAR